MDTIFVITLVLIINTVLIIFISYRLGNPQNDRLRNNKSDILKLNIQNESGTIESLSTIIRTKRYRFVIFLADRCSYCKKLIPLLNNFVEKINNRNDFLIAIGGSNSDHIKSFVQNNNILFHHKYFLIRDSYKINMTSFPSIYYLSEQGKILKNEIIEQEYLRELLATAEKQEEVNE